MITLKRKLRHLFAKYDSLLFLYIKCRSFDLIRSRNLYSKSINQNGKLNSLYDRISEYPEVRLDLFVLV